MRMSISHAVSVPSRMTPARMRQVHGWRLVVAAMSSRRSYMILTGRPLFHASSAAWPPIIEGYSSLPPKPPPVTVWITRTWSPARPKMRVSALWT